MEVIKELLPPKLYEVVERAGICTAKELITLSLWDIKKLTGLQAKQIELIKNIVAKNASGSCVAFINLLNDTNSKVKSGCAAIDNLLNGGFRRGVLIEMYGESGSGKTQLGMQLLANNASDGGVYISTEDLFPIKRYNQIHNSIRQHTDLSGNKVFIEHVYEVVDLLSCIRIRLPKLLKEHKVSIVIIDSVAAPFRFENTNYIQRADELREFAISLKKIARDNNISIVCVNQAATNFDGTSSQVLPSLGLAWSNMISYRLWVKKKYDAEFLCKFNTTCVRELKIIFSPDLPRSSCNFLITSNGITDL